MSYKLTLSKLESLLLTACDDLRGSMDARKVRDIDYLWNEVDKVIPDYYERKEWLRKNGAALDI